MLASRYISYLLPAMLGLAIVMQSGLNRKIASGYSFSVAALVNCIVLTILSSGVYAWSRYFLGGINSGSIANAVLNWNWWYVVPGMCGFSLVMGLPFSVSRIGALNTFIIVLVSQIGFSLVWDMVAEGHNVSWQRLVGVGIAVTGILLTILSK